MTLKRILTLSVTVLSGAAVALADEPVDSISDQHLDEVTVEAQNQRIAAKVVEYIPTNRQKNVSGTGGELLRHMAIPELSVSGRDGAITTALGEEVSFFIDYVPVQSRDMEGMRTKDVLRVEYLDYPTDPRFMGARHVVNFIMQQYEYGGYTKLSAREGMLAYNSGDYSVYSKMTYRRMTYDVYAGGNFFDSKFGHSGSDSWSTFRLFDGDRPYTVRRFEWLRGENKSDNIGASVRARYNTDRMQISNHIYYSRDHSPWTLSTGEVTYDTPAIAGGKSSSGSASQSVNAGYSGSFYFTLPHEFALSVSPTFTYSHNKQWGSIGEGDYLTVTNNVREDALYTRLPVKLNKRFGQVHNVLIGIDGLYSNNRVNYAGTYASVQRANHYFAAGTVGYSSQLGKFYTDIDGGISNEWNEMNGVMLKHFYPFLHVQEQYMLNDRSRMSLWFQYASNTPGASEKSDNYLRENEIMWFTGNPHLTNSDHVTAVLQYILMPSNSLQFVAYGQYYGMYNTQCITYNPTDNGYMVRSYVNAGDYNSGAIGVRAVGYLFKRRLVLNGSVSYEFEDNSFWYVRNRHSVMASLTATWYMGNFWVSAYGATPTNYYDVSSGALRHQPAFYQFSGGWGNSDWTVSVYLQNPNRFTWYNMFTEVKSEYYDHRTRNYNTGMHCNFGINVSYTFGYGKKVQRGDEVGVGGGASSAILQ